MKIQIHIWTANELGPDPTVFDAVIDRNGKRIHGINVQGSSLQETLMRVACVILWEEEVDNGKLLEE